MGGSTGRACRPRDELGIQRPSGCCLDGNCDVARGARSAPHSAVQSPVEFDVPLPDDFDFSQLVAIGLGSIFHTDPLDAWYLHRDLQSNRVDFAKLVIACNDPMGVDFSGNILGAGFDEASFENVAVPCVAVPEPKKLGILLLCLGPLFCARRRVHVFHNAQ